MENGNEVSGINADINSSARKNNAGCAATTMTIWMGLRSIRMGLWTIWIVLCLTGLDMSRSFT